MELRVFTEPQQGASYQAQLTLARLAEECGYGAFFRSDHYLAMGSGDGLPGPTDAWTALAGLARETRTIRLGTLVSPATFRLPGPLAITVAQVDAMSGGRVELGLGTGWYEAEHAAYGIPFPSVAERFDRLEEQLEIVTGLWSTPVGSRFSFTGRHHTLADSPALPKPVQSPVPVIVGGGGPRRTPALAARFAAEFNIGFCPVTDTAAAYDRTRRACEEIGRDPGDLVLSQTATVFVGRDAAEVARRMTVVGEDPGRPRDDLVAGTPDQAVERLAEYRAVGTERVYLQFLDMTDVDHVRLIAEEVMPHVR